MSSIQHANTERNTEDYTLELELESGHVATKLESARLRNRERRWIETLDNPGASARDRKYVYLSYLRNRLPHGFVTRYCMTGPRGNAEFVDLTYSEELKRAHYAGAHKCGSVHVCPVCADAISTHRRKELAVLLAQTVYSVCMVTFTFEHTRADRLADNVDRLKAAIRSMKSSRAWRRFCAKWGYVGTVWSVETTYGTQNGWHPHQHEMFVLNPDRLPLSKLERKRALEGPFQAELRELYAHALERKGLNCSEERGCVVSANRREYGSYIAKWGISEELSRSVNKQASGGNRSPWDLLDMAVRGDNYAWVLFLEYARALKGKKQLHWSKGLRALLALPEEEREDCELAGSEPVEPGQAPDRIVVSFARQAWYYLLAHDLVGALLNYCERVNGDPEAVCDYLARMGLRTCYQAGALLPLGSNSRFASASAPPGAWPGAPPDRERPRAALVEV